MALRIATWNINSVRLRAGLVEDYIKSHAPDVLCLQEIKCQEEQFPEKVMRKLGYEHFAVHGQKGYHGVAIISKKPLRDIQRDDYVSMGDARHVSAYVDSAIGPVRIHNFYVPAGGDEPDPKINPKFDHKLKFLEQMKNLNAASNGENCVLVGDLNIAPREEDVWSHKQLLKVVSHTPLEVELLDSVRDAGGWRDGVREFFGAEETLFSWWSYRSKDWTANNRGRRLDHIWHAPDLAQKLINVEILKEARSWEKPSDHVPILADYDV